MYMYAIVGTIQNAIQYWWYVGPYKQIQYLQLCVRRTFLWMQHNILLQKSFAIIRARIKTGFPRIAVNPWLRCATNPRFTCLYSCIFWIWQTNSKNPCAPATISHQWQTVFEYWLAFARNHNSKVMHIAPNPLSLLFSVATCKTIHTCKLCTFWFHQIVVRLPPWITSELATDYLRS